MPAPEYLDAVDRSLLDHLQRDGRMTNRALSQAVELAESTCHERVRRLENRGIIKRYGAVVDPRALGEWVDVRALITLNTQKKQHAFEAAAAKIPQLLECVEIMGDNDYLMRFLCRSMDAYQDLTAEMINDEALGIDRVQSLVVSRMVKEHTGFQTALLDTPESSEAAPRP